jgi:DNA repair exonuclease SbcCD ATPase subunit
MITLKKLKWSNCFSYGPNNELDLNENTVTQIIGSNGMGKSSIPLVIEEVLYNKNSKGIKKADIPNRYVNDGYSIYLLFEKDGSTYEVAVDRKSGIKVVLKKDGEDISSHTATNTYKTLQNVIGIDFKTFSQLVYQNTNASLQFLTATDTNRKKFLIDLLHLDAYVELFEIFKEASRESATRITELSTEATTIEKWLSNNKLESTIVLPMLDLDINTDDDEKSFRSLSVELENISEKNKKILQNNQYKDMLSRIDINHVQAALQQLPPMESYDKYQSDLGQLDAGIKSANSMLDKLLRLGDKCPTCEQDIDTEFKNELVQSERTKLDKLDSDKDFNEDMIRQIKRNNNSRVNLSKAEKEWEDLYRGIDNSLPNQILDKEELSNNLAELQTKLVAAKTELAKIAKENETRTRSNTRIEIIQAQTDGFIEKLNKAKEVLAQQAQLDSNLDVLKKAFSTNGLLAYKIENLVKELEELTNQYLAELSDGRFTLQFIVSNDKLNVQITDNEVIVDILALSSGELARVNTATLIAIRKLMSSISKSRINILFLDEVISVLDDAGREKLVEVLLAEDLNTYAVSHGWTHPLLEKIEVVKQGNISALDK